VSAATSCSRPSPTSTCAASITSATEASCAFTPVITVSRSAAYTSRSGLSAAISAPNPTTVTCNISDHELNESSEAMNRARFRHRCGSPVSDNDPICSKSSNQ